MAQAAQVLRIDPAHPDGALLARAAEVIRAGGLVAFPTETVYGLGANALDAVAVGRIYAAKGRDAGDPLIVHLPSAARLPDVARDLPPIVDLLGARFWPGPLTLVVPRAPRVPLSVTAGLPTVAVRVPAHPVARGLLEASGVPLAAPSANTFTRTSATTAAHVQEDLGRRVDLILDGGPAPLGIESTVLQVQGDGTLRLLRPGAVTIEALDDVLARAGRPPVVRPSPLSTGGESAPGATPGATRGDRRGRRRPRGCSSSTTPRGPGCASSAAPRKRLGRPCCGRRGRPWLAASASACSSTGRTPPTSPGCRREPGSGCARKTWDRRPTPPASAGASSPPCAGWTRRGWTPSSPAASRRGAWGWPSTTA